jgi:cysteine-rich secretory family protein
MGILKRNLSLGLMVLGLVAVARAQMTRYGQTGAGQVMPAAAEQLMALANQARAQVGAGRLQWDESLAAAARQHCLRMVAEGPIAHRYGGEADLATRAGQAGAHFDLIEENIAVGPTPAGIHEEWMHSPGHRTNLLNPEVNRVGVAVVSVRGVLYAAADYARSVQALTQTQVEARVANLIRASGVSIRAKNAQARAACGTDRGLPTAQGGPQATFVMRWQDSELSRLPDALAERLGSGRYQQAAIGSCPAQGVEGDFTAYRVAVLLY